MTCYVVCIGPFMQRNRGCFTPVHRCARCAVCVHSMNMCMLKSLHAPGSLLSALMCPHVCPALLAAADLEKVDLRILHKALKLLEAKGKVA